jgi:hypothetical protein
VKEAKWFRLITVAVLSAFVLLACGGGSDDGGDEGDSTEPVSAEQYVTGLCSAMVEWQGKAQELATTLQSEIQAGGAGLEIGDRKEKLTSYLENLQTATEDFIARVEGAGVPDVEGGGDVAENFLNGFRQLVDVIENAQEQIADLPETPAEFQAATDQLGDQLQGGFETIGTQFEDMGETPIDEAFEAEESCQQVQAGV